MSQNTIRPAPSLGPTFSQNYVPINTHIDPSRPVFVPFPPPILVNKEVENNEPPKIPPPSPPVTNVPPPVAAPPAPVQQPLPLPVVNQTLVTVTPSPIKNPKIIPPSKTTDVIYQAMKTNFLEDSLSSFPFFSPFKKQPTPVKKSQTELSTPKKLPVSSSRQENTKTRDTINEESKENSLTPAKNPPTSNKKEKSKTDSVILSSNSSKTTVAKSSSGLKRKTQSRENLSLSSSSPEKSNGTSKKSRLNKSPSLSPEAWTTKENLVLINHLKLVGMDYKSVKKLYEKFPNKSTKEVSGLVLLRGS